MKKTVRDLISLLEEFKKQKCSYSNVVRGLADNGWAKYLLYVPVPMEISRVEFMWMFEEKEAYPTEVTLMTHAYDGNIQYCFIRLDAETYQVAPPGSQTIEKE